MRKEVFAVFDQMKQNELFLNPNLFRKSLETCLDYKIGRHIEDIHLFVEERKTLSLEEKIDLLG